MVATIVATSGCSSAFRTAITDKSACFRKTNYYRKSFRLQSYNPIQEKPQPLRAAISGARLKPRTTSIKLACPQIFGGKFSKDVKCYLSSRLCAFGTWCFITVRMAGVMKHER